MNLAPRTHRVVGLLAASILGLSACDGRPFKKPAEQKAEPPAATAPADPDKEAVAAFNDIPSAVIKIATARLEKAKREATDPDVREVTMSVHKNPKFDVVKTDSLVNPYKATLKVSGAIEGSTKAFVHEGNRIILVEMTLTYLFTKGRWHYESATKDVTFVSPPWPDKDFDIGLAVQRLWLGRFSPHVILAASQSAPDDAH